MKNNKSVIDYLQTAVFSYLTHEQKLLLGPYFHDAVNKHKHEIMKAVYDGMKSNFDANMGRAEQYYNETYEK
jgi:hypothetical protein